MSKFQWIASPKLHN